MNTVYPVERKISIPYQIVGFLFFGTLIFFSWYFYKERMLLFDGAFYDLRLMKEGFIADSGRYGDFIGEILPWLAFKMGLSLSIIIMLHSVGLMLFHYAIFLFITLKLRNDRAGLAAMLVSCLAFARAFYIPTEQVSESMLFGCLLLAIIHPEVPYATLKEKRIATAGAILTIIFMSFFHPLGIFMMLFVLGFEMVLSKRYRDTSLWLIIILGTGWFLLKSRVLFNSQFDMSRQVPLSTIMHQLPRWKEWESTLFIKGLVKNHFRSLKWLTIICLLLSIRKGILVFLFCTAFIVLFSILFLGTFYKGDSSWTLECYFTIYGFFTGLLFVSLFYNPQWKNLALLISLPFLWLGIHKIYYSHAQYTYRLSYLSRIIKDTKESGMKKATIDSRCYPVNYAETSWDVALETLLYSSLPGPDSAVTVFIKDPSFDSICKVNQHNPNILFGPYFSPFWFNSDNIPKKYFRLPSSEYGYLTHPQSDSSYSDTAFSSKNIKIIPLQQTISARKGDWVTVLPLKIVNTSGKIIPAIPRDKNPVELSYRLYDKDGNDNVAYLTTPFETDIKNEAVLGLIIYLPSEKGTYFVKPDIVTVGKYEWNLSCPLITVHLD